MRILKLRPARTLIAIVAMLLVVGGALVFNFLAQKPTATHAASNGQEIEFACPPNIYSVTISGGNQNGNWMTWSNGNVNSSVVYTWGWWWKGWVKITYNARYAGNRVGSFTQWANIPSWQAWPNWYEVDCNAR